MKSIFSIALTLIVFQTCFSQEILVPYRDGNLWGLSNLKGEIKLKPVYENIEPDTNYPPNYFVAKKDDGVVMLSGIKEIIPTSYYNVFYFYNNSLILAKQQKNYQQPATAQPGAIDARKHATIFTLNGKDVYPEHFETLSHVENFGYSMKGKGKKRLFLFICKKFDGRYGLFQYDADQEKITKWLMDDYFLISTKGKHGITAKEVSNESVSEEQFFAYQGKQIILSSYEMQDEEEKDPFPTLGPDEENAGMIVSSAIDIYGDGLVLEYVITNGKIVLKETIRTKGKETVKETPIDLKFKADEITVEQYDDKVDRYYFNDGRQYKNYILFKSNGKYGLLCDGKVVAPEFDTLGQTSYYYPESKIYFIGSKNGKFGAISWKNEIIVPFEYDEIKWYDSKYATKKNYYPKDEWVVRKGEKFGMITFKNEPIVDVAYDEITKEDGSLHGFYALRLGDKFGVVQQFKETYFVVLPKFSRKPYSIYNNYQKNEKLNLIGFKLERRSIEYANPDGTEYFRN